MVSALLYAFGYQVEPCAGEFLFDLDVYKRQKGERPVMTAVIRTIILYLLIIVGIRLMGKRQIGELEPSELVLSLIIADLAAVPMQDFGTPLIRVVIPI